MQARGPSCAQLAPWPAARPFLRDDRAAGEDLTSGLNNALSKTGHASRALSEGPATSLTSCASAPAAGLQNCGKAPAIAGIQQWFNTPSDAPVSLSSLKGNVVLVDFWAYSCINCQRAITHVTAWYSDYKKDGFEVIGVHTPEYAFEHVPGNVAAGIRRLGIRYPVALDNNYTTWNNYSNDSWPADYLIDSAGEVRHVSIGEGDYSATESLIRQLLTAAHSTAKLPAATQVPDTTPSSADQTPETYLGSQRASNYAGGSGGGTTAFRYPASLPANEWALSGTWTVGSEDLTSGRNAAIELNFTAADVYLDVGGTGTITATVNGKTTAYRVSGAPDNLHSGRPEGRGERHPQGDAVARAERVLLHLRLTSLTRGGWPFVLVGPCSGHGGEHAVWLPGLAVLSGVREPPRRLDRETRGWLVFRQQREQLGPVTVISRACVRHAGHFVSLRPSDVVLHRGLPGAWGRVRPGAGRR